MSTKEKITQSIKQWLHLEKEIQLLQKELKERKSKKNELSTALVEIMKSKEIDCFDSSEGKIIYTKSNIKNTINKFTPMASGYWLSTPNLIFNITYIVTTTIRWERNIYCGIIT